MNIISFQRVNVTINTDTNFPFSPSQAAGPWWLQLKQEVPSKKMCALLTNDRDEAFIIPSDRISFQKGVTQQNFLRWFESSVKIASLSKFCNVIQDERGFHASLSIPKLGLLGGNQEESEAVVLYFYKTEKGVDVFQITKEEFLQETRSRLENNLHPKSSQRATPFFQRHLGSCRLETECDTTKELELLKSGEFWSFQRYMQEALFNKDFGYYADGKVIFGDSKLSVKDVDFSTYATSDYPPVLPYKIATQAAMMYETMRKAGDLKPGESFIIHENAPGLGLMGSDILEFCLNNFSESSNPFHRDFWQALKYQAAEISPELVKKCRANNEYFINEGKYEVFQASAYNLKEVFPNKIKGLVLSNELIDAAPLGAIRLNNRNEVEALVLAPCLDIEKAKALLGEDLVSERSEVINDTETLMRLQPGDFEKLQGHIDQIRWEHNYFPIAVFPELVDHIKQYGVPYAEHFEKGELIFLNPSAPTYMQEVSELLEKGFAMTIDYALLKDGTQKPSLRTYSCISRENPTNNFSSDMGKCDLTINIDLMPLIEAGKKYGLDSLATIDQCDLKNVSTDLDNPSLSCKPKYSGIGFFALIQQKTGTKAQFFIPAHSYNSEDIVNKARMYTHIFDQFKKHASDENFEFFQAFFEELTEMRMEENVAHFVYEWGAMRYSSDGKEKNSDLDEQALELIKKYDEELTPLLKQIVIESLA